MPRPWVNRRHSFLALLGGGLIISTSCASIHLNQVMEQRVKVHDLDLFFAVRDRDANGTREAAGALREALDDPAVKGYSSDVLYQEFLADTRGAVEVFLRKKAEEDWQAALTWRKAIVESCETCHGVFRR